MKKITAIISINSSSMLGKNANGRVVRNAS